MRSGLDVSGGVPRKLLMIHADDAGLSHSENQATIETLSRGSVNSYSIMVPCPWFYEMSIFAKENPTFDCGIHLTLTCEWENYKFGPVLPVSKVPSLVDENGHFFRKREALKAHASPEHVRIELEAQIEKALRFGIRPTHIDSHMYGVAADPAFFKVYRDIGKQYDLPIMISAELMEMVGLDPDQHIIDSDFIIEKAIVADFSDFKQGKLSDFYRNALDNLVDGINIILIHPAFDNEEMKGITINHPNFGSEWRQIDYDFFMDKEHLKFLEKQGVKMITWREIAEQLKDRS